jgi:uncharacterized protein YjbI with pentapeptide repeats
MIEIKSYDNRILYSLEKSEMFPDYRSVLQEALAIGIDLTGLFVKNEIIDNLQFNRFKINNVRFENCSMVNVQFIESEGDSIRFSGCNLNRIKFKRSKISEIHFYKSEMNKAHFIKSNFPDLHLDECNLSSSEFHDCQINNSDFYDCSLTKTIFRHSSLQKARYANQSSDDGWMQDVRFEFCRMEECDLERIKNLGILHINESNIDYAFTNNANFTKLSTYKLSILYAIESDIVWMNDNSDSLLNVLFRGSFTDFKKEVDASYPEWYVQFFADDFSGDWIDKACKYLEGWKEYKN